MSLRLLAVLALASGCGEVTLSALSVAPPGKTALLDSEGDDLKLSRGIAFGFECMANEGGYYGPCRDATARIDDETVGSVYASYLDTLALAYEEGGSGPRGRTAFVVVGLREGRTNIHVETSDGDITIDLRVE
jgi:hypothetical protein